MKKTQESFFLACAFIAGGVMLILEGIGFRILAPFFGYSVYVSGALIGTILASMSLGAYLGGILADKYAPEITLRRIGEGSVVVTLFSAFLYPYLLNMASILGVIWGSVVASIGIFFFPMLVLSMISPVLIKFFGTKEHKTLGYTAGRVYAIATMGSIAGIFLATFFLIPTIGSKKTFLLSVIILAIMTSGFYLLEKKKLKAIFCSVFVLLLFLPTTPSGVLFQKESLYNLVRVENNSGTLYLILNQPQYFHSMLSEKILTDMYYDLFLVAPVMRNADTNRFGILGLGAGTSLLQFSYFFPEKELYGIEIDPLVVEVGMKYFGLEKTNANIEIEDAKTFLSRTELQFDVLEVDVYQGGPFIPFYLTTQEFFKNIKDRLSDDGIFTMNIFSSSYGDPELSETIQNTVTSVFPSVFYVDYGSNRILYASKKSITSPEVIAAWNTAQESTPQLKEILMFASANIQEVKYNSSIAIFTDDLAPVEFLTKKMLSKPY